MKRREFTNTQKAQIVLRATNERGLVCCTHRKEADAEQEEKADKAGKKHYSMRWVG